MIRFQIGEQRQLAAGALRMTLGRTTTASDVDRAVGALADAITTLRARQSTPAQAGRGAG